MNYIDTCNKSHSYSTPCDTIKENCVARNVIKYTTERLNCPSFSDGFTGFVLLDMRSYREHVASYSYLLPVLCRRHSRALHLPARSCVDDTPGHYIYLPGLVSTTVQDTTSSCQVLCRRHSRTLHLAARYCVDDTPGHYI